MIQKKAILFLVFNRPDQTNQVFNRIREYKPNRLYISADGPRSNIINDKLLCNQVKEIVLNIDWECEVRTRFLKDNLGAGLSVSSAITWFFDYEEDGIILEDDCLPDSSFFDFCSTLLDKYKDQYNIMCISGVNLDNEMQHNKESIAFINYPLMWGWATWKNSWLLYDFKMKDWPKYKHDNWLKNRGNFLFRKFWEFQFDKYYHASRNVWDYQWFFTCWKNNGITIVPKVNLIKNIGFVDTATHTLPNTNTTLSSLESKSINFPLIYPKDIFVNNKLDRIIEKKWFQITVLKYLKRTLKNIYVKK